MDLSENAGQHAHEILSDREFEVLRMIASGKTVSEIAEDLHLSVTTVSTYRARSPMKESNCVRQCGALRCNKMEIELSDFNEGGSPTDLESFGPE